MDRWTQLGMMFSIDLVTLKKQNDFETAFFFQNNHMQRALLQQVSPCKPCADPHMNLPEKGNAQTSTMKMCINVLGK